MLESNAIAIDAVVAWVDGSDRTHAQKLALEIGRRRNRSLKYFSAGKNKSRYTDNNEVKYCLYGIRKFMPWIRNIYLVTDEQRPEFLSQENQKLLGVILVDHKTIFRGHEWALPTFNSLSIETMLFRIPGLSDRYIYFMDDVIPIKPSSPSDFFAGNKLIIRGKWEQYNNYGRWKTLALAIAAKALSIIPRSARSPHLLPQMRAANIAGFSKEYFHAAHTPHAVRTKSLREFFENHKDLLANNIRHKFRHLDQFTAHPLAYHLEAANNNHVNHDGDDCLTINFGKPRELKNSMFAMSDQHLKFVCIQGLELAAANEKERILTFLEKKVFGCR